MKSYKQYFVLLIMALITSLFFVSCAHKPSDSDIKGAVRARLQNNIPISWVGNLMGGREAMIHSIEIKEWGSYNKEYKYWPVRIRVIGTAKLNDPFNQNKIVQFDEIGEFKFYKDDYGEWKASWSRSLFQ